MRFALALMLAGSAVYGQQSIFAGEDAVIAHFIDGDSWKTSVQLNNIDAAPSQYKLSFFTESGQPLTMQTNLGTGTFIYGTIPARGSVTIETPGTNVALTMGWALMETIFVVPGSSFTAPGATITGTVLFFRPPNVSRPTEVSEPLDFSFEGKWALPFDHLNGYSSGVALVNSLTFQDISVFVTFFDENGNQLGPVDSFTLFRGQHVAFTLTEKYPSTTGHRGTMKIETSGISINVLGFRVSPLGAFSSTSPTSWF